MILAAPVQGPVGLLPGPTGASAGTRLQRCGATLVAALAALAALPAAADDGFAAFGAGDYLRAAPLLRREAAAGNAVAAAALAVMAERGLGAPADRVQAIEWYTRAAAIGLVDAQADLATHYYRGDLVPRDLDRAAHWWRTAAAAGDARAAKNLALIARESRAHTAAATPVEPLASALPAPVEPVATAAAPHDGNWVLAQPPGHYTVQLASGDDAAAIERFLRAHAFALEAAHFTARTAQGPRHTAILGTFAELNAARAAVAELPESVKARAPWIRKFGDIQAQMAAP